MYLHKTSEIFLFYKLHLLKFDSLSSKHPGPFSSPWCSRSIPQVDCSGQTLTLLSSHGISSGTWLHSVKALLNHPPYGDFLDGIFVNHPSSKIEALDVLSPLVLKAVRITWWRRQLLDPFFCRQCASSSTLKSNTNYSCIHHHCLLPNVLYPDWLRVSDIISMISDHSN